MSDKYLLFAGNSYYAMGGAYDFRGFFDSIELAQEAYLDLIPEIAQESSIDQWAHITDSNLKIVMECYLRESNAPEWDAV